MIASPVNSAETPTRVGHPNPSLVASTRSAVIFSSRAFLARAFSALVFSLLIFCPTARPSAEDEVASEAPPLASESSGPALIDRLPSTTLMYLEVGGAPSVDGTQAKELWNEEELQDFIEPAMTGIRGDAEYLMRAIPEDIRARMLDVGVPLPARFALLNVQFDEDADDPTGFEFAMECDLADSSEVFFDGILKLLREEQDQEEVEEVTIAGRRAIRISDDEATGQIVLDGPRWLMQFVLAETNDSAEDAESPQPTDLFEAPSSPLSKREDFESVRRQVADGTPVLFSWMGFDSVRSLIDKTMSAELDTSEPDSEAGREAQKLMEANRRIFMESPMLSSIQSFGYGVTADGDLLRDRLHLFAPGDRDGWAMERPLGDAPARHAALASKASDLLLTMHLDPADWISRSQKEQDRAREIMKEMGVDLEEIPEDLFKDANEKVKEAVGIDLENELVPSLGHYFSIFLAVPPQAMQVPDAGLIFDVADGAAIDAMIDKLLAKDEDFPKVRLSTQDMDGLRAVTVQLVDAGLPVIPTICRRGDQLLITTMPQSMKSLLRAITKGDTLATDPRHEEARNSASPNATTLLWCDLGVVFEYLYGFVGLGLSAARMSGAELGERFDGALLPSGDMLSQYLGQGTFVASTDQNGITYEGRSTLANPLLGTLSGVSSIAILMGISEGTREAANDERTKASRENLEQLAHAMDAYRGSVGGGSYPQDLVKLLDSGLLTERDRLLDPRDPKPRRVRSGTGGRVPVSYALGSTDLLPSERRPEGESRPIIYTRGAWHDWSYRGEGRLAIILGGDGDTIHVSTDEWGG